MSTHVTVGVVIDPDSPLTAAAYPHGDGGIGSTRIDRQIAIVSTDPDALDRLADALRTTANRLREVEQLTEQRRCLDTGDRATYEHRYLDHDVHGDWGEFCDFERAQIDSEIEQWSQVVTIEPIEVDTVGRAA